MRKYFHSNNDCLWPGSKPTELALDSPDSIPGHGPIFRVALALLGWLVAAAAGDAFVFILLLLYRYLYFFMIVDL